MKIRVLTSLLAVCASLLVADTLTIESPASKTPVSMMNCAQRMFAAMPESMLRPLMEDSSFCMDMSQNVTSFPSGILFKWHFRGNRSQISYRLTLADNAELKNAREFKPAHSLFQIHNLMPGATYYWKVAAIYKKGDVLETPVSSFTVSDATPRIMNVPGVDNCRDMGGWTGLEGRKVAYDKIFRNTGLNKNSSDGKVPGDVRFTPEGKDVLKNIMKIKTELDLRSLRETAGMTESPIGPDVTYINISSVAYATLFTEKGRDNYAQLFRIFCDEKNYPINFHCIAGADRTGTLGVLLLTTLGVSMDDAGKDYVFTSFYSRRGYERFDVIRNGFDSYGNADEPAVRKAERFLLQSGITPDEIMAFRDIMLGKGTQPGPVLEQYRRLEKIMQTNAKDAVKGIGLACQAVPVEAQWLNGVNYKYSNVGDWRARSFKGAGDAKGGNRFLFYPIANRDRLAIRPVVDDQFAKTKFMVGDLLSQTVFTTADGRDVVTGAEACQMSLPPRNSAVLLQISPADANPLPADWKRAKADFTPEYAFIETATLADIPVIDGDVSDAAWANIPVQNVIPVVPTQNAPKNTVKFAMDAKGTTLYLAGTFFDASPVARFTKLDSAVYNDDCCEIFLTDQNSLSFRQLAVNRIGGLYDGWTDDAKWNTSGIVIKTRQTADGWTLEMAIPLAQMKFDAPLNLNVTYSDYPTGTRFNMVPTGGSFHNRAAMLPVIVK